MEPINYNIDVKSPFESAMQGFQGGLAIQQSQQAQQQQQIAQQQQLQMQRDLAQLSTNQNAGAKDYASMMTKYPQLADHFKKSWDILNTDQKQNKLSDSVQIYSALQAEQPDIAVQLLKRQSEALANSGNLEEAKHADVISQLIQLNPNSAKTTIGLQLSSIMGPDKFESTFSTLGDQQRASEMHPSKVAQSEAEAKIKGVEAGNAPVKTALDNANVQSQINERSNRLGLDRDKLQSEIEMKFAEMNPAFKLDGDAKKIVNDSTVAAVAADQSASQMLDFANRLEQAQYTEGSLGKGAELYKSISGNQDAISSLKKEYVRIRSQNIKLPPGAASDKDVALAMAGFLDENANPKELASFIRGMAKLQQYDSALNTAKAEWVNSVGHLGRNKNDITVDGVKVPAGSTFVDFTKQFMKLKTEQKAQEQAVAQLQNRSYMRFAQPQQAPQQPTAELSAGD